MRDKSEIMEKILAVDDEEDFLNLMVLHLSNNGYQVTGAADPKEALRILEEQAGEFAVIITDWMMPKMSGNNLIRSAQKIDPLMESILITSVLEMAPISVKGFGAFEYLTKPLNSMKDLSEAVERAIIHREAQIQKLNIALGSQSNSSVS